MTINEATEQAYKNGYEKGIKDLAERLKEHTHDIALYGQIVTVSRIDNLAEEVVGEGDAGVIVKPLEEYLCPIDAYEGLKCKYLVFKADTGERVVNCFVLRPDKDAAAVEALRTYAAMTDNKTLSDDIYNWVGKGVTVQQWIPVTERLPDKHDRYLCNVRAFSFPDLRYFAILKYDDGGFIEGRIYTDDVTHWMPLPEPPKEV